MEDINQIFNCLSERNVIEGIRLNSNFLEANVINIVLLLSGLVYVLKHFLGSILITRQEKVLAAIQESEERLQQANTRLVESEKQLAQTQIVINEIIEEAESIAKKVRQSILDQGRSDIERLAIVSKTSIATAESQVRQQIQQQITTLAIGKVALQLQNQVTPAMQAKIIDSSIMQLGE